MDPEVISAGKRSYDRLSNDQQEGMPTCLAIVLCCLKFDKFCILFSLIPYYVNSITSFVLVVNHYLYFLQTLVDNMYVLCSLFI